VEDKMLAGVVSMPSNIFATTGTNVSVIFLDKQNKGDVVLIDASNLGTTVKEGKNQKTVLSHEEEDKIIETFNNKTALDDFSVVVSYDDIKAKNYSLSAGQYFEVKIDYVAITQEEYSQKIRDFEKSLSELFLKSDELKNEIQDRISSLIYE
jgi:type I restriction enzyme M protein